MRLALHPTTLGQIDPATYVRQFGHAAIGQGGHDPMPDAICPFCRGGVYLAAEVANRVAHFRHRRGAVCPSIEPAGRPYLPLPPGNPDPEAGARLRQAFRQNWRKHFVVIRALAPCLAPEEFIELIETATQNRVWDYVDFPEEDLPFAFLLLRDFPPWRSTRRNGTHERELWLRFFFSANVRGIDGLWILPPEEVVLHRVSFEPPRNKRGRPAYEDLIKDTVLAIDRGFLTRPEPNLPNFIVQAVEDWLTRHPEFAPQP